MLKNIKYAVVLGGTGGIGSNIVKKLVETGYTVIVSVRSHSETERLSNEIQSGKIITYPLDLESSEDIRKFVDQIKNYPQIEWLINSAGYISPKEGGFCQDQILIEKTFRINVESIISLSCLLLPKIAKNGGIINISSTAGIWGNQQFPVYASAKSALITFGISLAKKYKGVISSIIICPGPTNTDMREMILNDSSLHQDPDVIGRLVLNIVSLKTNYKNGDVIIVRSGEEKLHSSID